MGLDIGRGILLVGGIRWDRNSVGVDRMGIGMGCNAVVGSGPGVNQRWGC